MAGGCTARKDLRLEPFEMKQPGFDAFVSAIFDQMVAAIASPKAILQPKGAENERHFESPMQQQTVRRVQRM